MRQVPRTSVAAAGIVVAYAAVRRVLDAPFPGATAMLLLACGLALVPFLPNSLRRFSIVVAVVPALGIASYSALLTTVSIVGFQLTEASIALSVAALVGCLLVGALALGPTPEVRTAPSGRELIALGVLAVTVAFALASSWDIAYPFQARTDVGHYLLYAEEVREQRHLLIDDPLAGEDGRIFADPAAVGALYGSTLMLDGIDSWNLTAGIVVVSAISVLSVFSAGAALWGVGAGVAGAAVYSASPIRLDPMYWHGLGTSLALVFVPLVVLALGLMFRGERDVRTIAFLALSLVGVGAAHATSAIVVAALVGVAVLLDVAIRLVQGHADPVGALRSCWRRGIAKPVAASVGLACVLGAGVLVHLLLQSRALGHAVSYRFLDPHWLNRAAFEGYFGAPFLVLSGLALVLVVTSRRLRQDRALLAIASLGLACLAVSQLWRLEVAFEYRRAVYYLGVGLALLIGVAFLRTARTWASALLLILAFAYVARGSVGLRLPERVLRSEPRDPAVSGLIAFRERIDEGALPEAKIVTDGCLHFAVAYLVRRPTLPAFSERQVGFVDRLPLARKASRILAGGPGSERLAVRLGVGYAVGDPECTPDFARRLGGTTVIENRDLVVVRLPRPG